MTVAELIEFLKLQAPTLPVMVDGYEDGYRDITIERIKNRSVVLNVNDEFYYGEHGEANEHIEIDPIDALIFSRSTYVHPGRAGQ